MADGKQHGIDLNAMFCVKIRPFIDWRASHCLPQVNPAACAENGVFVKRFLFLP